MIIAVLIMIVGAELVNIYALHKLEQRIDEIDFRVQKLEARRRYGNR